jgi:hypothetical protein
MNTVRYNRKTQMMEMELNGNVYSGWGVEVKTNRKVKKPSDFLVAEYYNITLYNPDTDEVENERVYRKDCEDGLIEYLIQSVFPE